MTVSREPDSFEFADYLGILRRRWWLIVILACAGVLVASAYVALSAKAYTATVTVNVTPTGISQSQSGAVAGGRTGGTVNLDTEAQIVKSSTVAGLAGRALRSPVPSSTLLANVSVAVPANSSVLQISCTARTSAQAAACANAFGSAYLQNRTQSAVSTANAQLTTLRAELDTLERQTAQLTTQVNTLPANSAQRAGAQAQLETASSQLKALADQAATLTGEAASSSGGSILTRAAPPAAPSSPKRKLALPSGLMAGLVFGLIAAFVLDRRDKRIMDVRHLARLGLPALLSLPAKKLDADAVVPGRSLAGQEFTELARAATSALGSGRHLLLVAGAAPGVSTSVIAVNLAVMLARERPGVILVRSGRQGPPGLDGLDGPGELDAAAVAGLMVGTTILDEFIARPAGHAGLRVLTLAPDLGDLQHEDAQELAGQLRGSAPCIVIEAPVRAAGTDSLALAEFCDGALLAVELSVTKRPELEDSVRRLSRLGLRILGAATVPRLRHRAGPPAPAKAGPAPEGPGPAAPAPAETGAGDGAVEAEAEAGDDTLVWAASAGTEDGGLAWSDALGEAGEDGPAWAGAASGDDAADGPATAVPVPADAADQRGGS